MILPVFQPSCRGFQRSQLHNTTLNIRVIHTQLDVTLQLLLELYTSVFNFLSECQHTLHWNWDDHTHNSQGTSPLRQFAFLHLELWDFDNLWNNDELFLLALPYLCLTLYLIELIARFVHAQWLFFSFSVLVLLSFLTSFRFYETKRGFYSSWTHWDKSCIFFYIV